MDTLILNLVQIEYDINFWVLQSAIAEQVIGILQ